ncbi:hypothetical protein XELAEV_18003859mg [Xenopus laevis]|nr:hypothetical protein XELAEV_18003859mg [Xenopus laevis]
MSSKFMGKTYEKQGKKTTKLQGPSSPLLCQPQKMIPHNSDADQEHALIAAEVARLLNPVIEQSIDKATGKLQMEISKISEHLGATTKKFQSWNPQFLLYMMTQIELRREMNLWKKQLGKHKNTNSPSPNISTNPDHSSFLPQREHKGNGFE